MSKAPLVVECRRALERIAESFHNSIVRFNGRLAWGQFLAGGTEQRGVYGTSAGIRALVQAGRPIDDPVIGLATEFMLDEYDRPDSKANQEHDFANNYKLAFFLEALSPDQGILPDNSPHGGKFQQLFDRQSNEGGWGDFYFADNDRSERPSIAATAFAIGALSRFPRFRGSAKLNRAVTWLASEVSNKPDTPQPIIGLVLLSLARLPQGSDALKRAIEHLQKQVRSVLKRKPAPLTTSYVHFFDIHRKYHYLHMPWEVVALLALIHSGDRRRSSRRARNWVRVIAQHIIQRGGLVAAQTDRMSTVDSCWAALLMQKVIDSGIRDPGCGLVECALDPSQDWIKGLSIWLALLLIGTAGLAIGYLSRNLLLVISGGAASVVLLCLFVNLLTYYLQNLRK